MADKQGYIKLDRNMLEWRWAKTPNTAYLFIVLIMKANYKPMHFEGLTIQRGQLATSLPSLCESSGLSVAQVRTALKHLKLTGEVTVSSNPRFSVITVINYDSYQDVTYSLTDKRQTDDRQMTDKSQQEKYNKDSKTVRNKKKGRSAPVPLRGSPEFKSQSHILLKEDEGTADDIPDLYKGQFDNFSAYWRWRNQ